YCPLKTTLGHSFPAVSVNTRAIPSAKLSRMPSSASSVSGSVSTKTPETMKFRPRPPIRSWATPLIPAKASACTSFGTGTWRPLQATPKIASPPKVGVMGLSLHQMCGEIVGETGRDLIGVGFGDAHERTEDLEVGLTRVGVVRLRLVLGVLAEGHDGL